MIFKRRTGTGRPDHRSRLHRNYRLPVYCTWETYGLPGMKIKWQYALEYAGQLGHVAFRHIQLECMFESPSDQERFSAIWSRVIGKDPQFEGVAENERD